MDSRNDVKVFMEACDQNQVGINTSQANLYLNLIQEEYHELQAAYLANDIVEIADALADLKWVIEGLEHTLELPQQDVWNEVARSNLSKISSIGKVLKREDGKVLKPDTYSPPDIKSILSKE
jgi:predicted HAD superfamily Cof-like phosphohydrolase